MRPYTVFPFLLSLAIAQVPTDAIVVLETQSQVTAPNWHFVDPFGGGSTLMRNQSVFLQPSPLSVAADPVDPDNFFWLAATASLPGAWRTTVGRLAVAGTSLWGAWLRVAGDRIECGAQDVFTLRAGLVEKSARLAGINPNAVTPLFNLPNAVDLAATASHLYVVASGGGTLIEYSLTTGQQRVVGSYPGARSLAASPAASLLCVGTDSGELWTVDIASGAIVAIQNTGLGAIRAVAFTRFATRVWSTGTEVYSELAPGAPVYVSSTSIADIAVTSALTASVTPFGAGCGLGSGLVWTAPALPTLGNATFSLGLQGAPASAFALLALGGSRLFASSLAAPLPLPLAPLGAPGCALLADPTVVLLRPTGPSGAASQTVPIPALPALAGIEFAAQWFVPDGAIGPFGWSGSEGVAFVTR